MSTQIVQQGDSVTFTVRRGDTWTVEFAWESQTGTAIDLTGATVRLDIAQSHDSESAIASLADGSGLTIDPEAGTVTVAWDVPQDALGTFVFDIEVVSVGGETHTLASGTLVVTKDVTRTRAA